MPNVLNDTHHKKINAALHSIHELLPELDRAESVGVDVKDYRDRTQHLRNQFMALKAAYFPNKP